MARSVLALVACMVLLAPSWSMAQGRSPAETPQGSEDTHAPARFDIDEQALATALRTFSEQSGIAVLFDDGLVGDRRTVGVHGVATPRDALRILLVGTGLDAHFSSMNAFTVTAASHAPHSAEPWPSPQRGDDTVPGDADAALIQDAIEQALCAHASTRPGTYRLAMQVWIDVSGAVNEVAALAPSTDTARDARVLASVRSVRLPPRMARFSPVTILLNPTARGNAPCRGSIAAEG